MTYKNLTKIEQTQLKKLSQKLEISFNDLMLLKESLIHRSFLNELSTQNIVTHNERLEFLGDAVLELITTEYLFLNYPEFNEGDLTSFRAAIVRTESLAEESLRLEIGNYVYMSKGEEGTGGRERPYILANTFEAIVGAIFLDQGYEVTQRFIIKNVCYKLVKVIKERSDIDAKSKLQEIAQDQTKITPTYEMQKAIGPDHDKIFHMYVLIGENIFGKGKGKSKQEAEQNAAYDALKNWEVRYSKFFTK